jgi:pimeloyl-ACP methyl ester carboxylesterase
MRIGRLGLAVGVLALVATGCSFGSASIAPIPQPSAAAPVPADLTGFYDQQVRWTGCGDGAQCTSITVPLDYDHPTAATTRLAIAKVPATGESLGSLFVNPGGPGGSGFDYARNASLQLSPAVTEHFDIVGVDPRGVAKSDPVECLTDAQRDQLAAADVSPATANDVAALVSVSRLPSAGCSTGASPEYSFMGTPEVARDFDIARAVVGDSSFNYLGKSYGTSIGATYARLFPDRVGRMVLDGVLPTDLSLDAVTKVQASAFEASLRDFAADCVEHDDCPFSGDGDAVVRQIRAFLEQLAVQPIQAGSRSLSDTLASSAILSFLYFPPSDYPRLRAALAAAVTQGNGQPLLSLLDERTGRQADGSYADNGVDAYYAVTCVDRQYATTPARTAALAQEWSRVSPTFGAGLAWGLLPCSDWPARRSGAVSAGPYTGSSPLLIVNTTHDPATPAQWGDDLARSLGNTTTITWDAFNHTAYQQGSRCVDEAVDAYLLQGVVPAANVTCARHT